MNKRIVFFDGVCSLCNSAIDIIVKNSTPEDLLVAPLQGETASQYLSLEQTENLNSIVFYDNGDVFEESTAALKIAKYLNYPWKIFSFFIYLPRFVRDPIYRVIAEHRYQLFGKKSTCRLPSSSEKAHFLP